MLIYFIYFVAIAMLAVEYEFNKFKRLPMFVVVIIAMALLAGLRSENVSRDYHTYLYSFNIAETYLNELKHGVLFTFFEPGYILVVVLLKKLSVLNYPVLILLFFAFASLAMKGFAINRFSANPFLALLFYFSQYFMLLEMTQIRVAVSSAIFFVSLNFYFKKNFPAFLLLILLACSFHYSAALYLVVLLFNTKNLNRPLYSLILVSSVALGVLKIPLFQVASDLNPEIITGKLKGYEYLSRYIKDYSINTFNVVYVLNMIFALYFLFFVSKAKLASDGKLLFFIKCNILSVFLLSLLSGVPLVAFRFSELFGVTSLFMYAGAAAYLPFKKMNVPMLVLLAALLLCLNLFNNHLINAYEIANFR
jgi:hypothetical protein